MALTGKRTDPSVGAAFYLDMGKVTGTFRECGGLGSESEVIEFKAAEGGGRVAAMKVPGLMKYTPIVLKRGVTSDMQIWDWRRQVEEGHVDDARRDGSIMMYDQTHGEIARWNFYGAWPSKVSGPTLNAGTNEIAVEELTIVHERMVRTKVGK